jgi:CheY-like chemotaxis protein
MKDKKTWLIVEDNYRDAKVIAKAIGRLGASVEHADCLSSALRAIREKSIDFIVCDYILRTATASKPSGEVTFERTCETLITKARTILPNVPILLISSSRNEKHLESCFKAGADDFVPKVFGYEGGEPIFHEIFSMAVKKIYTQRQLRSAFEKSVHSAPGVYLHPKLRSFVDFSLKRPHEKILIYGESGIGKSLVSRLLAEKSVAEFFPVFAKDLKYFDFKHLSSEAILQIFWGDKSTDRTSVFHGNSTSVFVFENCDYIPDSLVPPIINVLTTQSLHTEHGATLDLKKTRIIFTCEHMDTTIGRGLSRLVHRDFHLKPLHEYGREELHDLVHSLCEKYRGGGAKPGFALDDSFPRELHRVIAHSHLISNVCSLEKIIQGAVETAFAQGRGKLFATDLDFPAWMLRNPVDSAGESGSLTLREAEILSQAGVAQPPEHGGPLLSAQGSARLEAKVRLCPQIEELIDSVIECRTLGEQQELLRKAAEVCSMERAGNSITKAAQLLGVSRQTFWAWRNSRPNKPSEVQAK